MGIERDIKEIEKDILQRDEKDRQRNISPLVKLPDAVYIDTTSLTIPQVVEKIITLYSEHSR